MKISILFFILAFWKGIKAWGKCDRDIPYKPDPHCGLAPECYYNAFNLLALDVHSCKRKLKGLPGIQVMYRGKCDSNKPKCRL